MGSELVKKQVNILQVMAGKYNIDSNRFMETLKGTIMKPGKDGRQATTEEVMSFLVVANKYDLNPFTREIFAFSDKSKGIIPIVSIDGFISLANRHPQYGGHELSYSDDMITMISNDDKPESKECPKWCEIKVHRKDKDFPVVIREYLDEVYIPPRGGYSGSWQSHTKRMLRHKTIIQGFRVAFGFSGIYDEDEANRIIDVNVETETMDSIPEEPKKIHGSTNKELPQHILAVKELAKKVWPKNKNEFLQWITWTFNIERVEDLSEEMSSEAVKELTTMLKEKKAKRVDDGKKTEKQT